MIMELVLKMERALVAKMQRSERQRKNFSAKYFFSPTHYACRSIQFTAHKTKRIDKGNLLLVGLLSPSFSFLLFVSFRLRFIGKNWCFLSVFYENCLISLSIKLFHKTYHLLLLLIFLFNKFESVKLFILFKQY